MQKHANKEGESPSNMKNVFYQEDPMDQLMDDNDLLNDDNDFMFDNDIEDDIAMVQNTKLEKAGSLQK